MLGALDCHGEAEGGFDLSGPGADHRRNVADGGMHTDGTSSRCAGPAMSARTTGRQATMPVE